MANESYLTPHAFFTVLVSYTDIQHHPFVRKRVIPALEKTHGKQITLLKQKYKKRLVGQKLSTSEIEDRVWGFVIHEIINHYAQLKGDDRGLSFGLFSGGADHFLIWDNYHKCLYPDNNFSFDLPLVKNITPGFEDEGEVYFRGKLSTATRNGTDYSVLRIYFYIGESIASRAPGETSISSNVGILCEIPYFFLRSDRYVTLQDKEATNHLLGLFELTEKDNGFEPLDFTPTDELGDPKFFSRPVEIGNKYASLWIR